MLDVRRAGAASTGAVFRSLLDLLAQKANEDQNPGNEGYLIDVQADLMAHLNTRLVVPLAPLHKAPEPAKTLSPLFTLEGVQHVMLTQYAATTPLTELKREAINLASRRDEIVAALDLLLQGF